MYFNGVQKLGLLDISFILDKTVVLSNYIRLFLDFPFTDFYFMP